MEAVEKITAETSEAETGVAKPLLETSFRKQWRCELFRSSRIAL